MCHNVIRKIEQKCFKEELQKQDKETQSKHEHGRVTQSCGVPMAISEGELRIFFSCKREKQQKNFRCPGCRFLSLCCVPAVCQRGIWHHCCGIDEETEAGRGHVPCARSRRERTGIHTASSPSVLRTPWFGTVRALLSVKIHPSGIGRQKGLTSSSVLEQ